MLNVLLINDETVCGSTYFTIRRGDHQTGLYLWCYRDEVWKGHKRSQSQVLRPITVSMYQNPDACHQYLTDLHPHLRHLTVQKNSHQLRPSLDNPLTNAS